MQEGYRWKNLLSGLATQAAAQNALPGLISPSSRQQSLYGPLGKRPKALRLRVLPPLPPSLPEGEIRLTGPTGWGVMMHLACVVCAHDSVTVITTVRSCVKAGFVHHIRCHKYLQCSTSKLNINSQRGCVTVRYST